MKDVSAHNRGLGTRWGSFQSKLFYYPIAIICLANNKYFHIPDFGHLDTKKKFPLFKCPFNCIFFFFPCLTSAIFIQIFLYVIMKKIVLENVRHINWSVSCINLSTESISFYSYTISKVYRDTLVHIMQMTVIYGMGSLIPQVVVKLQS